MTIDEAIAHEREKAEKMYLQGMLCHANPNDDELDGCIECAKKHEQLAELLEELKTYRENSNGYNKEDIELNRRAMYNKAIDDFLNKLTEKGIIGLVQYNEMSIIAEQLKAGRENED